MPSAIANTEHKTASEASSRDLGFDNRLVTATVDDEGLVL